MSSASSVPSPNPPELSHQKAVTPPPGNQKRPGHSSPCSHTYMCRCGAGIAFDHLSMAVHSDSFLLGQLRHVWD